MERRPGTPSLLRELNDRAALDLLLPGIALTRTQISEQTRVSKVTVAQMLARLEERGLVTVVGQQEGGRGPNAALYSVVPSSAYAAGLYVEPDSVSAGVADVTGRVVAEVSVNPNGAANPVELVRGAVDRACRTAGVEMSGLSALVIGSPGAVGHQTGDASLAINLPDWHEGVLGSLRGALNRPVIIENDVNLAAMAERASGAAQGQDDFVLMWIGVGLGMSAFLGGKVHRGAAGAAGEIGYLPVPGAPLPEDVRHPAHGGLQSLVGASVVRMLAGVFGFAAPTAEQAVRAAVAAAADHQASANGNGSRASGPAARANGNGNGSRASGPAARANGNGNGNGSRASGPAAGTVAGRPGPRPARTGTVAGRPGPRPGRTGTGTVAGRPGPRPAPTSSSASWPAVSRPASPRWPSSSIPAWLCWAATWAWPAARRSPTGWPPKSHASAPRVPASCPRR